MHLLIGGELLETKEPRTANPVARYELPKHKVAIEEGYVKEVNVKFHSSSTPDGAVAMWFDGFPLSPLTGTELIVHFHPQAGIEYYTKSANEGYRTSTDSEVNVTKYILGEITTVEALRKALSMLNNARNQRETDLDTTFNNTLNNTLTLLALISRNDMQRSSKNAYKLPRLFKNKTKYSTANLNNLTIGILEKWTPGRNGYYPEDVILAINSYTEYEDLDKTTEDTVFIGFDKDLSEREFKALTTALEALINGYTEI